VFAWVKNSHGLGKLSIGLPLEWFHPKKTKSIQSLLAATLGTDKERRISLAVQLP